MKHIITYSDDSINKLCDSIQDSHDQKFINTVFCIKILNNKIEKMTQEKTKLEKYIMLAVDIVGTVAFITFIAMILFIINGCTPQPVEVNLQDQMTDFSKSWNRENQDRYDTCKNDGFLPTLNYETGKYECLKDLKQIKVQNKN